MFVRVSVIADCHKKFARNNPFGLKMHRIFHFRGSQWQEIYSF